MCRCEGAFGGVAIFLAFVNKSLTRQIVEIHALGSAKEARIERVRKQTGIFSLEYKACTGHDWGGSDMDSNFSISEYVSDHQENKFLR